MKNLPKTKTPADLRQVSITTHPGAEEAVTALVGRVSGQTPSVYADMATGLSTVSVYLPLPDATVTATRAALRAGLADLEESGIDAAPGANPLSVAERVRAVMPALLPIQWPPAGRLARLAAARPGVPGRANQTSWHHAA